MPRPHFTPGKDLVPIVQEAGWAPGPVWMGGKSRPHPDSISDRPARSSVAIPTELPSPHLVWCRHPKQHGIKCKYCISHQYCHSKWDILSYDKCTSIFDCGMVQLRAVWSDQSLHFPFHPNRKMNFLCSALISYLLFNIWSVRKETKQMVDEILRCSEACKGVVRCPNICTGKMFICLICRKMRMCDLNVLLQMTEWKVAIIDLEIVVNTYT